MLPALASADLVVGRAGSSTLAEVTALGVPMIVVPYPHAAGHQRANARALVDAGAARLVEDADFDAEALLAAAAILDDSAVHVAMAGGRAVPRPTRRGRRGRGPRHGGRGTAPAARCRGHRSTLARRGAMIVR